MESLHGKAAIEEGTFLDLWTSLFGKKKKRELKVAPKPEKITEFDSEDDWIMTMILIAIKHAFPELKEDEMIRMAYTWARKMGTPNTKHLWRKQLIRMGRIGASAEASKIRRELYKML